MIWSEVEWFLLKSQYIYISITCIHVSSKWRSGDVSGDETAGGKGWISFGTTTKSLPKTNIAPALFAVPVERGNGQT